MRFSRDFVGSFWNLRCFSVIYYGYYGMCRDFVKVLGV